MTSAAAAEHGVEETAAVYFMLADRLQLGRLRDLITALPREDRWSSASRSALRDDLYAAHAALTRDVLAAGGIAANAGERIAAWESQNSAAVSRAAVDPGRDLGEQPLHLHHPVGGRPGDPEPDRPAAARSQRPVPAVAEAS